MQNGHDAPNALPVVVFLVRLFWKKQRFCPCRYGTRIGLGVGLGLGLGSGWPGPTCKIEIDQKRPAGKLLHARQAGAQLQCREPLGDGVRSEIDK